MHNLLQCLRKQKCKDIVTTVCHNRHQNDFLKHANHVPCIVANVKNVNTAAIERKKQQLEVWHNSSKKKII